MSQLVLSAIPGFFDLADSAIAAGQPLTDDTMLKISHSAKFGAVRGKLIFMGFYANGNTVPTPVDPDDYYTYARSECQFVAMIYSNRAPAPGMVPGQATPPPISSSQPGPLYNFPGGWDIDNASGLVTLWTSYYANGTETVNNDGIIKVYAICLRWSQSSQPAPGPPTPTPAPPASPTPPGQQVAAVSLADQDASLGSVTSPVTILTVAGAGEFSIACTMHCTVPATKVLNSLGDFAQASVTLVWGASAALTLLEPASASTTAWANSDGVVQDNGFDIMFETPAGGATIWYYTVWTVESPLSPGACSYDLSIVLDQVSPAPTTPSTPPPTSSTQIGAVSLPVQTASLGTAASPVAIVTVEGSGRFTITWTLHCNAPDSGVLNSNGLYAEAFVTLAWGASAPIVILGAGDTEPASAWADSNGSVWDNASELSFGTSAGQTTIWYYTTWVVQSPLAPADCSYDLNIVIDQISS